MNVRQNGKIRNTDLDGLFSLQWSTTTAGTSIRDIIDLSHDSLAQDLGRHGFDDDARFVSVWGIWLFWTGTSWEKDNRRLNETKTREFLRMRAKQLVDAARIEGSSLMPDQAAALLNWAKGEARTLRNKATITAVEKLVRSNPQCATSPDCFDRDPFLLGTPAGTVDLKTGQLRPSERADLITKLTAYGPAETGTQPELWLRFLNRTFAGDQDMIKFMQRAAGYALTGLTNEHKLLFFYGGGRNGKGVFGNTLNKIWGAYARNAPASLFLASAHPQHPTELAGLQGARLVIGSEIPRNATWNEARLKDLTGGDSISARFMRGDYFNFNPQFTLMIAGNDKPRLNGVDPAIRARMVLVPFEVQIPEEERDPDLVQKLMAEAPAILRWAIEGALDWQKQGLDVPASIKAASEAYLDEEDLLKNFLQEETLADPDDFTSAADLHDRFKVWCERQGVPACARRIFSRDMQARGLLPIRRSKGYGYIGVRLR